MQTVIAHSSKYVAAFLGGLFFSLALTPLIRTAARRLGMIDQPSERRIHKAPTPRGGGFAILLAFHASMGGIWLLSSWADYAIHLNYGWWLAFLYASSILGLIGYLDDKYGLSAWIKLAGQILVATLMYGMGYGVENLFGLQAPEWVQYLATLAWYVLLTNAFNLIDGLDGLASGLAFIAALGLAGSLLLRGMPGDTLPLLVLAGACLGFLRYNFNPASIFLGDTGSLFLGFALASMSLASSSKGTLATTMVVPLLAMGIPLYDTLLAVWRRSVRAFMPSAAGDPSAGRSGMMRADKDHLHHRFLALGLSQRRVAVLLYTLNVLLVVVGLLMTALKNRATGIFLIALVAWGYIMFRHLSRIEVWETGRLFVLGFSRPKRRSLVIAIYGLWDMASVALAWTAAFMAADFQGRVAWLQSLVLMGAPLILLLLLGQVYERIWSRARLREYILLVGLVGAGALAGLGLEILFGPPEQVLPAAPFILFTALAGVLIAGGRMGFRVAREFLGGLEDARLLWAPDTERVLAYGAGGRFQLFLREHLIHVGEPGARRVIVGVADDDPNLRGCRVSGVAVLGGEEALEEIIRAHRIRRVVITACLDPAKKARLAERIRAAGAEVREWRYEEAELP